MKLSHKSYSSGDPLLILHGLFGLGDNWRTIPRMMEDDVQSILVDLRNHGRSPHGVVMNFQVMADDVMELIDDLELENVSVMGHSLGGKVAMQMTTQFFEICDKRKFFEFALYLCLPSLLVISFSLHQIARLLIPDNLLGSGRDTA